MLKHLSYGSRHILPSDLSGPSFFAFWLDLVPHYFLVYLIDDNLLFIFVYGSELLFS